MRMLANNKLRNKNLRNQIIDMRNKYGTTGQFIKNNIDYQVTVQSINAWIRGERDLADVILDSIDKFIKER